MKRSSLDRLFNRLSVAASTPGRLLATHVELTRRCNLRCKHCYLPRSKRPANIPELELSSVKEIIDQLHAAGCLLITLTGGEVFTRPDITVILDYLWRKGFVVNIATNGTLINEEMACFLGRCASPTHLWISLYGLSKATTKYATGVDGVSDRTLRVMELLKKNKVAFTIEALVTRNNLKELEGIRELARQFAVRFECQYFIYPRIDGSCDVLRHQIALKDLDGLLRKDMAGISCAAAGSSSIAPVSRATPFYCAAGKTSMAINAFGKACVCLNLPFPNLDVLSSGVEAGWRKVVEYVNNAEADNKYHCHECDLSQYCAWCPAMGWLYKKDLNACVPFYKREAEVEKAACNG